MSPLPDAAILPLRMNDKGTPLMRAQPWEGDKEWNPRR